MKKLFIFSEKRSLNHHHRVQCTKQFRNIIITTRLCCYLKYGAFFYMLLFFLPSSSHFTKLSSGQTTHDCKCILMISFILCFKYVIDRKLTRNIFWSVFLNLFASQNQLNCFQLAFAPGLFMTFFFRRRGIYQWLSTIKVSSLEYGYKCLFNLLYFYFIFYRVSLLYLTVVFRIIKNEKTWFRLE